MSDLQTLICLIGYAPVPLPLVARSAQELNEVPLSDLLPGWDDFLQHSTVEASVNANGGGRVRGQAYGVSNPFTNFRTVVGADFGFRFLARRDQMVGGVEYEASVDVRDRGRFLHFAAVPWPDDERQPPAVTTALVHTGLRVGEVDDDGHFVNTLAATGQIVAHSRVLQATQRLEDIVMLDRTEKVRFTPSGTRDVVCRVSHFVHAAATGEYSDIRITGSLDESSFDVRARNARIARVLLPEDPCYGVLHG